MSTKRSKASVVRVDSTYTADTPSPNLTSARSSLKSTWTTREHLIEIEEMLPHLASTAGFHKRLNSLERSSGEVNNERSRLVTYFRDLEERVSPLLASHILRLRVIRFVPFAPHLLQRYQEPTGPGGEVIPIRPAGIAQRKYQFGVVEAAGVNIPMLRHPPQTRESISGGASGQYPARKESPPVGNIVTAASIARTLTVEMIGRRTFTAIWEQDGQQDRRVRFSKKLVLPADHDLFRVGAEFYWQAGRRIIEGRPVRIDQLRFRREPPPTKDELDRYRQLASRAIAAQRKAQQARLAAYHAERRATDLP